MYRSGKTCQRSYIVLRNLILSENTSQHALNKVAKPNVLKRCGHSFAPKHLFQSKSGSSLWIAGGSVCVGLAALQYFSKITKAAEIEQTIESKVSKENEDEEKLPTLPSSTEYLLIGGGTASYSALKAIRKRDPSAKILIITEEDYLPYMRPPLSKELWFSDDKEEAVKLNFKAWNGKWRNVFYQKEKFFTDPYEFDTAPEGSVSIIKGRKVIKLLSQDNVAELDDGSKVAYNKCLIATGGSPRTLPNFKDDAIKDKVTLFRSAADFKNLYNVTENVESITVIGGGFLGSELACALANKARTTKNYQVNQIFPEAGNMGRVLPEYLTKWTTNKVRDEGVNVVTESLVKSVSEEDGKINLSLSNGQSIKTDHVVVAVGLDIDTSLAQSAGIEVDEKHGGYRVNAELQGRNNIWVAGDAACFYDMKLGRRRVEHHDHAVVSGRLAGMNMAGAGKPYWHQSMFWSDLGPDVGYEAIGIVDSSLPTVGVFAKATEKDTPRAAAMESGEGIRSEVEGSEETSNHFTPEPMGQVKKEEFGKGVVFYLRDSKVVGVLLWNIFGRMPVARKIISDQQAYDDYSELAKFFKIYSDSIDED